MHKEKKKSKLKCRVELSLERLACKVNETHEEYLKRYREERDGRAYQEKVIRRERMEIKY